MLVTCHFHRWASDRPGLGSAGISGKRIRQSMTRDYALRDVNKPIGVAEYQLIESLPVELQTSLPSIEQIERELEGL